MEHLEIEILHKLYSFEEKIRQINKKNAFNCKALSERIFAVFEIDYQKRRIKAKQDQLVAECDCMKQCELNSKSEAISKIRARYFKCRNSEIYTPDKIEYFNKFMDLYYENEFKLKKKIL
jgi:hypothetical protein